MSSEKKPRARIVLEPELEFLAATLSPAKRRALAQKFERWARQLMISAYIMENDGKPWKKRRLPWLKQTELERN